MLYRITKKGEKADKWNLNELIALPGEIVQDPEQDDPKNRVFLEEVSEEEVVIEELTKRLGWELVEKEAIKS